MSKLDEIRERHEKRKSAWTKGYLNILYNDDMDCVLTLLQEGQKIVEMLYHDFPQDDEMVNDWLKAVQGERNE